MENPFKKLCNLMDYNTYKKIYSGLLFAGVGSNFLKLILTQNNINLGIPISLFSYSFYMLYIYLYFFNGEKYTKDINEIRKLYFEFIKNYNKLNKLFDLNDPVSIYTMYNYLVYNGYLSVGKSFEFAKGEVKDIPMNLGVNVVWGSGVCRNISSMMRDILNDYGIPSCNVGCFVRDVDIKLDEVGLQDYSRDELLEWVNKTIIDEDKRNELIEKINLLEKNGIYVNIDSFYEDDYGESLNRRRYGNHLITYSLYDGKSYYLDPTQERIYRINQDGNLYDRFDDKIILKKSSFKLFNDRDYKESYKLKGKYLLYNETISLEEEERIVVFTKNLCMNNNDIFLKFYNENKELYEEISSKLVKIKIR